MNKRHKLLALALIGALILILGGLMNGQPRPSSNGGSAGDQLAAKIEPRVLAATENGQSTSFLILLNDQADLRAAYGMQDQDARGWYVYRTLSDHAERTQTGIRELLRASGVKYQSFWAANAILCYGGRNLLIAVAARSDVRAIEANHPSQWVKKPVNEAPTNDSPNGIEWNVQNVRAPQVWALGFKGQGIVIGNEDTGMQWDHPALKPHYRGWNGTSADHNYNWHDAIHDSVGNPCGNNSPFPCDDFGHGTHTTGTTSGDDGAGNQIGVAPGAKWIGCRNMDAGVGTPARYTECFQFMMAPTDLSGNNPDPTRRAHVINNSWTCPASEGCAPLTLLTIVQNVQAAGIFVEASAGNAGSGCSTVTDPPAIYAESFSTGAYDSGNNLASFSSRGPVTSDGSGRVKPDISAPGVNVRSSVPGNGYSTLSGTSMAGPHVVGSVALLWSAVPSLQRQIDQTKATLTQSANPGVHTSFQVCGGIPSTTIPNNSFGYGAVDAFAAVSGPDFIVTASPASQTVTQGGSASYTATLTPVDGFTGNVNMGVSGLPSGAGGTFTPNPVVISGGAQNSTLNVTTAGNTPTGTYTLSITGMSGTLNHSASVTLVVNSSGQISLSPTSLTFGKQAVNTTSAAKKVTVTNTGTATVTFTSIASSGDYAQTNTCGGSLLAGKKCVINVTFTPTALGTRSGAVTLTDSASGSPQTVPLTGTGIAPVTLAPTTLTFKQAEFTTSAAKVVKLTNNQSIVLNVSSVAVTANYGETDNCTPTVAPMASCNINITFTPPGVGAFNGTLTVTDNASNSPQTASLTGTGLDQVTFSKTSLTFGMQTVGTTSAPKPVILKNNLSTPLAFTTGTSGDFAESDTCGGSVAANGGTCTMNVTFKPTAVGTRTGTLTITDGADDSPQHVSLTGTGK